MTSRLLLIASLAVFAAAPAYAFEVVPGPEAGASLGAMALVVTGYLGLRRRIGR